MAAPDWLIPTAGIAGACVVAFANYLVQRWRYRIDRLSTAVDHLCVEINDAADRATSYWLLDTTQNDQRRGAESLEPQLVGRQMRIVELLAAVSQLDARISLDETDEIVVDFYDKLTGANFQVKGRGSNFEH